MTTVDYSPTSALILSRSCQNPSIPLKSELLRTTAPPPSIIKPANPPSAPLGDPPPPPAPNRRPDSCALASCCWSSWKFFGKPPDILTAIRDLLPDERYVVVGWEVRKSRWKRSRSACSRKVVVQGCKHQRSGQSSKHISGLWGL